MTVGDSLLDVLTALRVSRWSVAFRCASTDDELRSTHVIGVTHDSRRVQPGWVFCCVRGATTDGHRFAADAVAAGASALVVERVIESVRVPQIVVEDTRQAMGRIAAAVYGFPADKLQMIGITGTNGKTTTATLLGRVLASAGRNVSVVGTLTQKRTTPESTDLQETLAGFVAAGVDTVVMEVTSHALELHRVSGITYAVGVFTNLSQDHLDFHGTMEAYFRAKAKLFEPGRCDHAVVNLDDPYGQLLLDARAIPTTGFRMTDAKDLTLEPTSSTFRWEGLDVTLAMGGAFNVMNALAAASAAALLGVDGATIAAGLAGSVVPGRFEPVDVGQDFGVIVDFAHTPDGLERVLRSARATLQPEARLVAVFGCGGDRDRGKRPIMARIGQSLADEVIFTSDNPRSESADAILDEMVAGLERSDNVRRIADRRTAIETAIQGARSGDVVVIAGKGHESGQEVRGVVTPFDDRTEALSAISTRLGGTTPT